MKPIAEVAAELHVLLNTSVAGKRQASDVLLSVMGEIKQGKLEKLSSSQIIELLGSEIPSVERFRTDYFSDMVPLKEKILAEILSATIKSS